MNIVVTDTARLAGEADYPMLDLPKYGWQQYPELAGEEIAERCWRADVIVATTTPIDRAVMDKAFKLQLIVVAGEAYDHIDLDAARERGIQVSNVPGRDPANPADTAPICIDVIETIAAYTRDEARNRVA